MLPLRGLFPRLRFQGSSWPIFSFSTSFVTRAFIKPCANDTSFKIPKAPDCYQCQELSELWTAQTGIAFGLEVFLKSEFSWYFRTTNAQPLNTLRLDSFSEGRYTVLVSFCWWTLKYCIQVYISMMKRQLDHCGK